MTATAPRTIAEIFCHRRKAEKTAELRQFVVAQKEPDAKAAPAKPHQPYPAGAAVHSEERA